MKSSHFESTEQIDMFHRVPNKHCNIQIMYLFDEKFLTFSLDPRSQPRISVSILTK